MRTFDNEVREKCMLTDADMRTMKAGSATDLHRDAQQRSYEVFCFFAFLVCTNGSLLQD